MSGLLRNLLGGQAPQKPLSPAEDADFADFAGAPAPSPASSIVNSASSSLATAASNTPLASQPVTFRPYTKWYRVWERVTIADFYSELLILPFLAVLVLVHLYGSRTNRRKARSWVSAHKPILESEYALVGFDKLPKFGNQDSGSAESKDPIELLKEKTAIEYLTYATGRQNVAFTDFKLTLKRRHNPAARFGEEFLAFFFESQPKPIEHIEVTSYTFDGKESDLAPLLGAQVSENGLEPPTPEQKAAHKEQFKSSYDGFVFAVVHKDLMRRLREDRYDLSLTTTKDNQRLPSWATIMSESAEIAEQLLTSELIKAIEAAGEPLFESLIVTDMPVDQPKRLNDVLPRKRISLAVKLPSSDDHSATQPIFKLFLRLPDHLAQNAHYRPEAMRRIKATREDEIKKIKQKFETEAATERKEKADKEKKEERDKKIRGLSADEQRKALERERAQDLRKGQKRRTMKA